MGKTIKVSDELYEILKKQSEETGSPIGNLVNVGVTVPIKSVTVSPEDLCKHCKEKIQEELLKGTKITLDGNKKEKAKQSNLDWFWLIFAFGALVWLITKEDKQSGDLTALSGGYTRQKPKLPGQFILNTALVTPQKKSPNKV